MRARTRAVVDRKASPRSRARPAAVLRQCCDPAAELVRGRFFDPRSKTVKPTTYTAPRMDLSRLPSELLTAVIVDPVATWSQRGAAAAELDRRAGEHGDGARRRRRAPRVRWSWEARALGF